MPTSARPCSARPGRPRAHPISACWSMASPAMAWYDGPGLLDHLAATPSRSAAESSEFRFPVQLVVRTGQDFRGLAGTVTSGMVRVGDEVTEPVSGQRARVSRVVTMGRD